MPLRQPALQNEPPGSIGGVATKTGWRIWPCSWSCQSLKEMLPRCSPPAQLELLLSMTWPRLTRRGRPAGSVLWSAGSVLWRASWVHADGVQAVWPSSAPRVLRAPRPSPRELMHYILRQDWFVVCVCPYPTLPTPFPPLFHTKVPWSVCWHV